MGEKVLPADSLWDSGSKMVTSISAAEFGGSGDSPDILLSFIILAFFVGLVVFSRELITVIPNVIKAHSILKIITKLKRNSLFQI